jgi:hypothetical protein
MLNSLAWISIALALASAIVIAVDEVRHPQNMGVMNLVWPITALYLSAFAVWWYFRVGRTMTADSPPMTMDMNDDVAPNWAQSALAASHCGAGCALADLATEFAIFGFGLTIAGSALSASFLYDFIAAWSLGIIF